MMIFETMAWAPWVDVSPAGCGRLASKRLAGMANFVPKINNLGKTPWKKQWKNKRYMYVS